MGDIPEPLLTTLAKRRPDLDDPSQLVACGWDGLSALIQSFIDVGTSKFVILPVAEPTGVDEWITHLGEAAQMIAPHEN
jgi:hypothetical protein